jgi:hypothetical protein
MASIALLVGGALVNALAFSGSSFLFSSLKSSGVDAERKRHDKAVEQLNVAHEAWTKKRPERIDWINEERRRQGEAVRDFQDTDAAMREYARVFGKGKTIDSLSEPQLADFYVPSEGQKDREIAFVVLGLGVTGLIAYEISKRSA